MRASTARMGMSGTDIQAWLMTCQHCGKQYRSRRLRRDGYCGDPCRQQAARVRANRREFVEFETQRACMECGARFHPNTVRQFYCSRACAVRHSKLDHDVALERVFVCEHCGKMFTTVHSTQRYCSSSCRLRARASEQAARSSVRERACEQCGGQFVVRSSTHKFCSASCRKAHGRVFVERSCERCAVVFAPRSSSQRYCSLSCKDGAREREHSCVRCGCSFQALHSNQRYCSRECRVNTRGSTPRTASCRICGGAFEQANRRHVYCSNRCRVRGARGENGVLRQAADRGQR